MEMYRYGDRVHVTLDGESIVATVVFASVDGRNLLLDAGRWFFGSLMPVTWRDAEGWREVAQGRVVEIGDWEQLKGRVQTQISHWRAVGKDHLATALEQCLLNGLSSPLLSEAPLATTIGGTAYSE